MRKAILTVATLAMLGVSAFAGDIWWVNRGAYASTDWNSLKRLYNMTHNTTAYRDYRDYLLNNGILVPVSGRVEVIRYLDDAAVLQGADGNMYYLPQEDFGYQISSR